VLSMITGPEAVSAASLVVRDGETCEHQALQTVQLRDVVTKIGSGSNGHDNQTVGRAADELIPEARCARE